MSKARKSHPLRTAAVGMMMRGEASPAEVRQVLQVSRQLIRYWCIVAGIAGKTREARKAYLLRQMLKEIPKRGLEPEHAEIRALRHRLKFPRPSLEQLERAKGRPATDLPERELPEVRTPEEDRDISF